MQKEYKSFSIELKQLEDGQGTFEGYASTFGNIDRTGDRIEKGAFLESINSLNGQIKVLENHDFDKRVGLANIMEDEKGLRVFNGKLNLEKQTVRDLFSDMKFGLVDEFSIGFFIKDFTREEEIRIIKSIELVEVSLVTIPANPEAKVTSVKSFEDIKNIRDAEVYLREVGDLSRKGAKHLISVIKGLPREEEKLSLAPILDSLKSLNERLDNVRRNEAAV